MPKKPQIVTEATGIRVFPGAIFRVALAGRRNVLAHISGKMRKYFVRIVPGDKVEAESHQSTRAIFGESLFWFRASFLSAPQLASLFQHRFVKPTHTVAAVSFSVQMGAAYFKNEAL
jgi:translation initiation factor IF-1